VIVQADLPALQVPEIELGSLDPGLWDLEAEGGQPVLKLPVRSRQGGPGGIGCLRLSPGDSRRFRRAPASDQSRPEEGERQEYK
jgi:hypothetical protein